MSSELAKYMHRAGLKLDALEDKTFLSFSN